MRYSRGVLQYSTLNRVPLEMKKKMAAKWPKKAKKAKKAGKKKKR